MADDGGVNYSHLVETDCLQQVGRSDNIWMFVVPEEKSENQ